MVLRTLRDSKENGHHTTSVWVRCFLGDNQEKEDNKKEDKTRKGSGKIEIDSGTCNAVHQSQYRTVQYSMA